MSSLYIQSEDYATYGLANTTTAAQVTQASTTIDSYLKRPEGLIWTPDELGNPCFMAAANPSLTLTSPFSIIPGLNVTVLVTGPMAMMQPGDVLILDRANPTAVEAVVINSTTPAGPGVSASLGFQSVVNTHGPGALLDAGMVIQDQRALPDGRPLTQLSRTPVARLVSGAGRYSFGRRSSPANAYVDDYNLLSSVAQFAGLGGPPIWEGFNTSLTDVNPATGEVWIPSGMLATYYTEVKLRYLAGFSAASLPSDIKLATAQLVQAIADAPNLGAVKSYKAGDTAITRFADTMISGDTKRLLEPYRASMFR